MFPLPYLSLFSFTLILSTFLAFSANQWLLIWMALELNLLSFIPLLTLTKQFQETEGAIKYFLAQALGSGMILLSLSLSLDPLSFNLFSSMTFLTMTMGILLKMGMPPCHFWFPSVMASLSWPLCLILSTWQKLIPASILIFSFSNALYPASLFIIASMAALTGGMGGINQTQLRPLLAYSSITHMGWILALTSFSSSTAGLYITIYIVISVSILLALNAKTMLSMKSTSSLLTFNSQTSLLIMATLLSLGGLPPLLGFFPKWLGLVTLIYNNQIFLSLFLIFGSLLSLYYYLTLAFSLALSFNPSLSTSNDSPSLPPFFFFILTTSSLPLIPSFIMIF